MCRRTRIPKIFIGRCFRLQEAAGRYAVDFSTSVAESAVVAAAGDGAGQEPPILAGDEGLPVPRQIVRAAAHRAFSNAGNSRAINSAMIEMTSNSSMSVKPRPDYRCIRLTMMAVRSSAAGAPLVNLATASRSAARICVGDS